MGPVEVANLALAEIGNRVQISSFSDGTPAAQAASLFYTPKIQMLLRAAPWDFARGQVTLSQLKATVVNGVVSNTPPPQPWNYEYAKPSDCLKARFLLPTLQTQPAGTPLTTTPNVPIYAPSPPTSIPFVMATDFDAQNNSIEVILTNLFQAQLVYVRDLSQTPDLWDPMFLAAVTATLASYFINALARNNAQVQAQAATAKSIIETARAASGNEGISNIDHIPDWMQARMRSGMCWSNPSGPNGVSGGWEICGLPGGLFF